MTTKNLFFVIFLLVVLSTSTASGQMTALIEISENDYSKLIKPTREDLKSGDSRLNILPTIRRLNWIATNSLALRPEVAAIGAQRWALVEMANDGKSQARPALFMRENRMATISQAQAMTDWPNDPLFGQQKATLDLVGIPQLWKLESSWAVSKVAIAIMDTGIQCSHPDLALRIDVANSRSFSASLACEPTSNHGTMVAGVAGAEMNNHLGIAGVSRDVPLLDWKIFEWRDVNGGKMLYTDEFIILRAFLSVLELPYERVILNCSFQLTDPNDPNRFWERAIGAISKKALVVAGSGNESLNTSTRNTFPGTLSKKLGNVICLGNIDKNGVPSLDTGFGDKVELAAPGVNIMSTSTDNSYGSSSGVSLAIPHVSGVAGTLVLATDTLPGPSEIKQALLKGASLNLNLISKIPEPRQLNGWRSWLAITGQLDSTPLLFSRVDYLEDGDEDSVFSPAPYSWVVIHGKGLADGYYSANQIPLPKTLSGVQVLVNGRPMPLLSVYPERIDFQMENDFLMFPSPTAKHSLAIVRVDKEGNQIVGSQLVLPSFIAVPAKPAVRSLTNSGGRVWDQNPAKTGEQLVLWVNGLGRTDPEVRPGVTFDGTERVMAPLELFFDEKSVPISARTIPGAVGMFGISFTMPRVESQYSAKATLCSSAVCTEFWFNYDGKGSDTE